MKNKYRPKYQLGKNKVPPLSQEEMPYHVLTNPTGYKTPVSTVLNNAKKVKEPETKSIRKRIYDGSKLAMNAEMPKGLGILRDIMLGPGASVANLLNPEEAYKGQSMLESMGSSAVDMFNAGITPNVVFRPIEKVYSKLSNLGTKALDKLTTKMFRPRFSTAVDDLGYHTFDSKTGKQLYSLSEGTNPNLNESGQYIGKRNSVDLSNINEPTDFHYVNFGEKPIKGQGYAIDPADYPNIPNWKEEALEDASKVISPWFNENKMTSKDRIQKLLEVLPMNKKGGLIKAQNGIEGTMGGYTDIPFKYNSAWGGQFQMGGSLPGSVGFTYARTQGIPSEGPYAKKTMPSAQNGKVHKKYLPEKVENWQEPKYVAGLNSEGHYGYDGKGTINYDPNSQIENINNPWWVEHEKYHHFQTLSGRNPKERRQQEVDNQVNEMIKSNPGLQFIPKSKLISGSKPNEKGQKSFVGAEDLIYENPSTLEGEARLYEDYINSGGKSIFPKQENGGMSYYQHGLDWKPKSISKKGSKVPKAQVGIKYVMPRAASESTSIPRRDYELERQIALRNTLRNQPQISQSRPNTPYEEAERRRKNKAASVNLPYAQYNEATGDLTRKDPSRGFSGEAQTPNTQRFDKGLEHMMNATDAAGLVLGVGAVGKAFGKEAIAAGRELGEYLTTQTPLRNAYKLNPVGILGNKLNSKFYNPQVALNATNNTLTGIERNLTNSAIEGSDLLMGQNNLKNLTGYNKLPKSASEYENYFRKLEENDKNLQKLLSSEKITYDDYLSQRDLYKNQLQKELDFGQKVGSGTYGEVFEIANDPSKVIKIGTPYGGIWTPELIESLKSVKQNANIAIPEEVQILEIPSLYEGYRPSKKEVVLMPNLNKTTFEKLNLNKRDRYAYFLKQARQLRDKGIKLDVENPENFKYNELKNVFDIYDVNPGHINNPAAYMRYIKDKTQLHLLDNMMYKRGGLIKAQLGLKGTPLQGVRRQGNYLWNNPIEINQPYPQVKFSDTGVQIPEEIQNDLIAEDRWSMIPGFDQFSERMNPANPIQKGRTAVGQPITRSPQTQKKEPFNPYFMLRGATTGLSWLANNKEMNRQNQYMYNQYSTLGQMEPANIEDFQPNYYSLYARFGGKVSKQMGGEQSNIPIAQKGGREPITVTDKNDPRLRAYNDSLQVYNAMTIQNKLMGDEFKDKPNYVKKGYIDTVNKPEYSTEKLNKLKQFQKEGKMSGIYNNYNEMMNSDTPAKNKQLIKEYRKLGIADKNIGFYNSPDLIDTKVKPVATYFDGAAYSPYYKKPVQPYIFQEQPGLQKRVGKVNPITTGDNMYGFPDRLQGIEIQQLSPIPQGNYMVGYFDESNQGVDRGFPTQEMADEFVKELQNRNLGSVQPYRGNITQYRKFQKGGREPITVTDKNDPRLKAYNDSLDLYNNHSFSTKNLKDIRSFTNTDVLVNMSIAGKDFINKNKIKPIKIGTLDDRDKPIYKKPVQPVVYKKPDNIKTLPNIKVEQRPTYADSLKLHNLSLAIANRPDGDVSLGRKPEGKFYKYFTDKDAMEYLYPTTPDEIKMAKLSKSTGIMPTRYYPGEAGGVYFKKPVGTPEPKDYPIVTRPKGQVRGTISGGEMSPDTTKSGASVFGPANSLIGYWKDGQFWPTDGAAGKVNQADLDLKNNPEELSKFLRGKGLQMKKGGFMGINPEHKGYCTPMTKSTCTPHRKALAKTLKKYHGFHKKK